jgi:soluble lytic murein transglycosylase-like protein
MRVMKVINTTGTATRGLLASCLLGWLGLTGFISDQAQALSRSDAKICESYLPGIAKAEDVPLGVLYAVGLTETGVKGSLHPYALNVEGRTIITYTQADALREFNKARRQGKKLIDLGCMQVNFHYHGENFNSPAEMMEPEKNIIYAARFLKTLRASEGSWAAAVARYHASPRKPAEQRRYICSVIRNLIASDFGGWTPASRAYCRR